MVCRLMMVVFALGCGGTPAPAREDAPAPADSAIDAPFPPGCDAVFARASAGVTPFGPTYGAFPPAALPPLAYLSPPYDCIAVRVETLAPDGVRIQLYADQATGWGARIQVDGVTSDLTVAPVGEGVLEGVATLPNAPTYITLVGWKTGDPACTRNVSLRRFSDGTVAVVGYGGADCAGPRSLKKYKTAIEYLDAAATTQLRDEAMNLRLARFQYRGESLPTPRLGIMLDDLPADSPVARGDRVDLYGYASMAIAAVQAQQREIAELRAQLQKLEAAAPQLCR